MIRFRVSFHRDAEEDLDRLHGFLAELDPDLAASGVAVIGKAVEFLQMFPWACRRALDSKRMNRRELVITFSRAGYVALFDIVSDSHVVILAIRHQREGDFH